MTDVAIPADGESGDERADRCGASATPVYAPKAVEYGTTAREFKALFIPANPYLATNRTGPWSGNGRGAEFGLAHPGQHVSGLWLVGGVRSSIPSLASRRPLRLRRVPACRRYGRR